MTIEISSSLMCADLLNLESEILKLEKAGTDMFHMDIMDGHFVNNLALSIDLLKAIRSVSTTPLEAHLMVENPLNYIEKAKKAGADIISVHLESTPHIHKALKEIRECNMKAGIAINPGTSHLLIEPLLEETDFILTMAVNPGFAGQEFIKSTVNKVYKINEMLKENHLTNIKIEVDGNINSETIPPLYNAGARIFVGGTSGIFFGDRNYERNIENLKNSIK
ncbi:MULTISPECIES: ribulose-phosphate 3-epimerase [Tepidanaerobacter]|uniref:Ribulose-phosphate 3-epimerase n=1 Tax=Tepidanaerobacter syntrophicus TaxID=224999 RepID=A0A0U9HD98_9FIRM|nr:MULTISPECIES: ribulose-phosphate 3-epimerase [Tepidanaerobacter]GAQ24784.1 ribulose-phosphate 3-epimerase [Tepidanaerobacter syntrophicus]GLI18948.1 ribulose-phosphate 3-epimerase [Tepidanaerobacter syntrophicus]